MHSYKDLPKVNDNPEESLPKNMRQKFKVDISIDYKLKWKKKYAISKVKRYMEARFNITGNNGEQRCQREEPEDI